ncbi:hypothetical protein BC829DRAFT_393713 [Chytridium lagenaria]|nr:hypothetical protein BC829DRAFT_393713 [Chytridium lagenaria]
MALEKFGEEKSVAHALCLCDFGGMMKMDEFLERALGMLEGVEEGGERWVAIGKVKLEMLRKVQGVEWEEEDEVREETEEELEKAKKEAELFEGLRKAYRTVPPIPSTILRWTLALLDPFEASGLPPVHLTSSNLDDDDEDDTESQDTVDHHAPLDTLALQRDGQSLILVRGLCLYTLARCDIDVSDKEGASENLWEAITVLARVDGFDGEDVDAVMEATEVIGQCYVMLGSTELDEESAAEAFENGVKVLKGLSAGMPENERLKKLVKCWR